MWTSVSHCPEPVDGLATRADHQGHIQSFRFQLKPVSEGNVHVSQGLHSFTLELNLSNSRTHS